MNPVDFPQQRGWQRLLLAVVPERLVELREGRVAEQCCGDATPLLGPPAGQLDAARVGGPTLAGEAVLVGAEEEARSGVKAIVRSKDLMWTSRTTSIAHNGQISIFLIAYQIL